MRFDNYRDVERRFQGYIDVSTSMAVKEVNCAYLHFKNCNVGIVVVHEMRRVRNRI